MNTLRVLIVEDEMIIAKDISAHLEDIGIITAGIIRSGEEVLTYMKNNQVDMVLMDIALDGHLDGIDTARLLREKYDVPIIYLTANSDDKTFNRAKSSLPFAFVEKPFKKRTLIRTVELLIEHLFSKSNTNKNDVYMLSDRIFVKEKNTLVKIFLKDIYYFEADRAYCKIITQDRTYLLATSLGKLEAKLYSNFLKRIHRSYIVNLTKIDKIEDHSITLGNTSLPVSRSYWHDLSSSLQIV